MSPLLGFIAILPEMSEVSQLWQDLFPSFELLGQSVVLLPSSCFHFLPGTLPVAHSKAKHETLELGPLFLDSELTKPASVQASFQDIVEKATWVAVGPQDLASHTKILAVLKGFVFGKPFSSSQFLSVLRTWHPILGYWPSWKGLFLSSLFLLLSSLEEARGPRSKTKEGLVLVSLHHCR